jgi:hypothetical protein
MIKLRAFLAPRGYAEPDGEYRSLFGFVWWFWIPRLHTQHPDEQNPQVIRGIWLCFAAGVDIWMEGSRKHWPLKSCFDREK